MWEKGEVGMNNNNKEAIFVLDDFFGDDKLTHNMSASEAWNCIKGLLTEQEPVEPILKREGRNKYYNYYVCPRCDEEVVFDQNYCLECGAKFMWEGR